jgi:predicted dehydrogenase
MNILIVGLGNIGTRHLEALNKSEIDFDIYVYDININVYKFIKHKLNHRRTIFLSSIDNASNNGIPENIDVAIVATSSFGREILIGKLILNFKIKNLILEKVLFQQVESYSNFVSVFKEENINCYVNCPRRVMKSYKILKNELSALNISRITINGGGWNLLSNTIHFLDIIHFFTNDETVNIDILESLSDKYFESKRRGYIEMNGAFSGQINGIDFIISCDESNADLVIEIEADESVYSINETLQKITVHKKSSYVSNVFNIEYVSTTSLVIVEDLLRNHTCGLAKYSIHSILGESLIKLILAKQNTLLGENSNLCQVT